ncbi:alpha/beta fold hydrolase [Shewanella abyssi]|uniref:alpha/beta hydrolase n=1 Tax=Shewanella abyssi TaxID=311789 RepID=UPI00201077C7|nr:alpha/beta hydrolase [Shewanella abyssi]MCL1049670.1 alpha/beta fold hydrolase [Shewanella abyssi]
MKKITFKLMVASLIHFASPALADDSTAVVADNAPSNFFSLSEIKAAPLASLPALDYVTASDGETLALRAYLPRDPKAMVIFYHGAGAHSGLIYPHVGGGLRDEFNIAVFTPDIRGHGSSSGPRGDAPDKEQVWQDINSVIEYARQRYPSLPLYMAGHSSGSGLILNYSSWKQHYSADGYFFVAPYFGHRSETEHDEPKPFSFTTVSVSSFVANAMSGGLLMGHSKAVQYHFPQQVLDDNPKIVSFNTVNMSNALTPAAPDEQLTQLQRYDLWIGDKDEAFDANKVIAFAEANPPKNAVHTLQKVAGENHFSILLTAHQYIGNSISEQLKEGEVADEKQK